MAIMPEMTQSKSYLSFTDSEYINDSLDYLRKRSLFSLFLFLLLHLVSFQNVRQLFAQSDSNFTYLSLKYLAMLLIVVYVCLWVKKPSARLFHWNALVLIPNVAHMVLMGFEFADVPAETAFFYLCGGFLLGYSVPVNNTSLFVCAGILVISLPLALLELFPGDAYILSYITIPMVLITCIIVQSLLFEQFRYSDYQTEIELLKEIELRKEIEEEIKHLANHDALTGLPSLRLARDRLAYALEMSRRYEKKLALMFIDIDDFKSVNDNYGHDVGDYLLQEIAIRLKQCIRKTDTVARIGGDEFLLLQTEVEDTSSSIKIAEEIIKSVGAAYQISGHSLVVSASIGIAYYPDDGVDAETVIKKADDAMYQAKRNGKNSYSLSSYDDHGLEETRSH